MTHVQLQIDFAPGLTTRFRSLKQACAHAVYASRKGLSGVAADLDMSPSELTKRLSDSDSADNRPLRSEDVEQIVESTGDKTPVFYMVERWLQDPKARRDQALAQLATVGQQFIELAAEAGISLKPAKAGRTGA